MAERRYDFFVMTAEVTYLREGTLKQRRMNTVMVLPKAFVAQPAIDGARQAILDRTCQEHQLNAVDIKDFVILGISHLGRGTEAEFNGEAPDAKPSAGPRLS